MSDTVTCPRCNRGSLQPEEFERLAPEAPGGAAPPEGSTALRCDGCERPYVLLAEGTLIDVRKFRVLQETQPIES